MDRDRMASDQASGQEAARLSARMRSLARILFYTFPAAFLKGPAAAGGLALVNATGNIGGFVGPIVVGWVAQRTGNPASGLLVIAAAVVLAPAIILAMDKKKISEVE